MAYSRDGREGEGSIQDKTHKALGMGTYSRELRRKVYFTTFSTAEC